MLVLFKLISGLVLLSVASDSAYAQCWSVGAGAGSSASSTIRPENGNAYEAILIEMELALQQGMGVSSKVYMIEQRAVYANPATGDVYFGRPYFDVLDNQYKPLVKQLQGDPIPAGIRLIIAHEYAHQFQFRMFKKRKITLATSTPVDELQADVIASYFLGSRFDAQFSNLPTSQKVQRVLHESGGAMFVVAQLGDFFFNDAQHHGDPNSRRQCLNYGFEAGWVNKFGVPSEAMTSKADEIYDWSRDLAEKTLKTQIKGRVF